MTDGWLTIRQRKTGKVVAIPVARTLAEVLEATPRRGIVILLGERGTPYTEDGFRTQFWKVTVAAGTKGLAFLDLRRSSVVRLAESGSTVPEIAAITGHTIAETQRIIDTYWVATRRQAKAAILKLDRAEQRKSPRASPRAAKRSKLNH